MLIDKNHFKTMPDYGAGPGPAVHTLHFACLLYTSVILDRCDPEIPSFYDLIISDEAFSSMKIVASPKMTPGNRVILDALVEKYAPGIEVAESSIELS